ncbi:MAG TPA: HEAT repeat domain-containing protein [Pyrinomonadaceae bacterium]
MHISTRVNSVFRLVLLIAVLGVSLCVPTFAHPQSTSIQETIEAQRQRLNSADAEERRDALMKLGSMRRPEASSVAMAGLSDAAPMVRAVAAKAILAVGSEQSVPALLPLLNDKDDFVRREAAYALGLTKSRAATSALTGLLVGDKEDGVRSAAAVALGEIGDEAAVISLAGVLAPEGKKREKNGFVMRAAARSLGQTRSRAGVPALVVALGNEKLDGDIRREAAQALGLIGDPSAVSALRTAATSEDPYLAQAAVNSLKKLTP